MSTKIKKAVKNLMKKQKNILHITLYFRYNGGRLQNAHTPRTVKAIDYRGVAMWILYKQFYNIGRSPSFLRFLLSILSFFSRRLSM